MPLLRNYSDNYLSGMDPNPKHNVAVECFSIDTTRFATIYVMLVLIVFFAISGSGSLCSLPPPDLGLRDLLCAA